MAEETFAISSNKTGYIYVEPEQFVRIVEQSTRTATDPLHGAMVVIPPASALDDPTITDEKLTAAHKAALEKIDYLRAQADITDKVATILGGKYLTRKVLDLVRPQFPEYNVSYRTYMHGRNKYISFQRIGGNRYVDGCEIFLPVDGANRIEAYKMHVEAEELRQRAASLNAKLLDLYENVAQYNTLVPYLLDLYNRIERIMCCGDPNFHGPRFY